VLFNSFVLVMPCGVQVPDAKDDVLAAAVLDQAPAGSFAAGTEQLLAALPKHFPITVSTTAALYQEPEKNHYSQSSSRMSVCVCSSKVCSCSFALAAQQQRILRTWGAERVRVEFDAGLKQPCRGM
jgi:hypothetical protein